MKLYTLEGLGKTEPIRLLLFRAQLKFEYVNIARADWPKYKDKFELKQLPVLEVDGKQYCQSTAILGYLGVKYGFMPKGYDALYRTMFIINTLEDYTQKLFLSISPASPLDAKAKADAGKQLLEVEAPLFFGAVERKLQANRTQDFMVGKDYSIADFAFLGLYFHLQALPNSAITCSSLIKDKFPVLQNYINCRRVDFNPLYRMCRTEVHYFDMPGRGEMVRIALRNIGMPFEDVRIKKDDWPALKVSGRYELQQLPIISCVVSNANFCQADALLHRIGSRYNRLPLHNPEKLYRVVWWCGTLKDIMEGCLRFVLLPVSPEKKKEMRDEFFASTAPTLLVAMEDKLKLNATIDYLVGRSYTIADFYFVGVWRAFVLNPKFPELQPLVARHPTLIAYFARINPLL
jgi:glutathione S-transferase